MKNQSLCLLACIAFYFSQLCSMNDRSGLEPEDIEIMNSTSFGGISAQFYNGTYAHFNVDGSSSIRFADTTKFDTEPNQAFTITLPNKVMIQQYDNEEDRDIFVSPNTSITTLFVGSIQATRINAFTRKKKQVQCSRTHFQKYQRAQQITPQIRTARVKIAKSILICLQNLAG